MNGRVLPDSEQANSPVDDSRIKEYSIHQAQEAVYQFLIGLVNHSSPETALTEFRQLFVGGQSTLKPDISQALQDIINQKDESEFRNTIKRACYILINNWSSKRQYQPIQELIQLLAEPTPSQAPLSPNLNRLRSALTNFINSQDYQELKLFASPYNASDKLHWSHRYTSYLLVPQYLDSRNPIEQREIAKNLSKRLRKKFKFDLAMYTARCDSPTFQENEVCNPTRLGNRVIYLIKKVGFQYLLFSHANYATSFVRQIQHLNYEDFKKNFQKYLLFSVSDKAHLEILDTQLSLKLDNLYSNHQSKLVTTDLLLRTCKQVIDFLTTEDGREPSSLFILLTTQGSPLTLVITLLKIIRICKYAQTHLEVCIAKLILYYERYPEKDCKWLINFLDIFNVIFTIYNEDIQYNLVKVKYQDPQSHHQDTGDNLEAYRVFSQLKGTDLRGAELKGVDIRCSNLSAADLREANLSGADLSHANLSLAKLSRANLSSALLNGTELSSTLLNQANLSGASLRGADLRCANLQQANLSCANLIAAKLRRANLRDLNASCANISCASLYACDLRGADLRHANLSGANLSNANLSGANLSNANLSGANLSNANLSGANLKCADLTRTDLSRGNLSNTELRDALLRHVNLIGVDLSHANLGGVNLFGTNLSNITVKGAQFWHNSGLSEETKLELMQQGAIVEIPSSVTTPPRQREG